MDENLQIQLGSTKHVNSVNTDTYTNIQLENNKNSLLEYDINSILSVSDVFEQERQDNANYRIYGGLEYFSLFNGMKKSYRFLSDFFSSTGTTSFFNSENKTIYDDFYFYLVRPSNNFTKLPGDTVTYVRNFEVIATPNDFELIEAGFSKNIFNQQKYFFSFNEDFDVSNIVDGLGMPLTELFLFAQYKPKAVSSGTEEVERSRWLSSFSDEDFLRFNPSLLTVGRHIYGDKIEYYRSEFNQIQISPLKYKIITPYLGIIKTLKSPPEYVDRELRWVYEPLIPLRLRYFSNELNKGNINSSSYEQANNIPEFATDLNNGNYVWRNILEQGYIDPNTGNGVDYPFVNKRRYLFSNVVLSISPDLTHSNTANVFREISFDNPDTLNSEPISLNNIGNPC